MRSYSANLGLRLLTHHGGRVEAQAGVALICDVMYVDFSHLLMQTSLSVVLLAKTSRS